MPGPRSGLPPKDYDEISPAGFERLAEALREVIHDKGPSCVVCGKPVNLRSSVTNEDGQALHPECAVSSIQGRAS
jgi:hypothetical protein